VEAGGEAVQYLSLVPYCLGGTSVTGRVTAPDTRKTT